MRIVFVSAAAVSAAIAFSVGTATGGRVPPAPKLGARGVSTEALNTVVQRYCATCHLTTTGLGTFGTQYSAFRTAMASGSFGSLDYTLRAFPNHHRALNSMAKYQIDNPTAGVVLIDAVIIALALWLVALLARSGRRVAG